MRLKLYYTKQLFDVNLKEYNELENVLTPFFIAIFPSFTIFWKRFRSNSHKYSNLKLVGFMRFNLKQYRKLETVLASHFIEVFPVSECFRKEFD